MRRVVRNYIVPVIVIAGSLLAGGGEEVYKAKCAACHQSYIPMEKLTENFLEKENKLLKLKAPTLNQLSFRLKQQIGDPKGDEEIHRMEVGAFVADYLVHPDKEKSVCLPGVIKYFDTMPSLKGKISEDEIEAVSNYIYDYEKNLISAKSVKYQKFEAAAERAKKEHKIIMVKATSKHCHYCKKMDREVLIDNAVVKALNKDFVVVSVDIGKDTLPLGLQCSMTPTFFFMDSEQKLIKTIPGAWNKEDFLEILNEAKKARISKEGE